MTATTVVCTWCRKSVALLSPTWSRSAGDRPGVQVDPVDDAVPGSRRAGLRHHDVGRPVGNSMATMCRMKRHSGVPAGGGISRGTQARA